MQWSVNKYIKKQIHQGKIKNTYSYESLWASGAAVAYILPSYNDDNSSTVQIMVIFVS